MHYYVVCKVLYYGKFMVIKVQPFHSQWYSFYPLLSFPVGSKSHCIIYNFGHIFPYPLLGTLPLGFHSTVCWRWYQKEKSQKILVLLIHKDSSCLSFILLTKGGRLSCIRSQFCHIVLFMHVRLAFTGFTAT